MTLPFMGSTRANEGSLRASRVCGSLGIRPLATEHRVPAGRPYRAETSRHDPVNECKRFNRSLALSSVWTRVRGDFEVMFRCLPALRIEEVRQELSTASPNGF
jgi:hypothetical protein